MNTWPDSPARLVETQHMLAAQEAPEWQPSDYGALLVGGCFVCFGRGYEGRGAAGDPAWAGAAVFHHHQCEGHGTARGGAGGAYAPGLLALREGQLLEAAVRQLRRLPDVLLVNATGKDHPRRAGLAVHLGAMLEVPTIGVTHRPLLAGGRWPADVAGASNPLLIDGEVIGSWLRTHPHRRPIVVHAGWRTGPDVARGVVWHSRGRQRTPEPLRAARRVARTLRAWTSRPPGS